MTIDPEDYLEPRCPLEEPCGCNHEHAHGSGPGAEYTHGNGCDCGEADGIFGSKTLAAVRKFQQENILEVDGIVGEKTWGALLLSH